MSESTEKKLDATGLFCPEPVFRTKIEIERMQVGEIIIVTADDPAAATAGQRARVGQGQAPGRHHRQRRHRTHGDDCRHGRCGFAYFAHDAV